MSQQHTFDDDRHPPNAQHPPGPDATDHPRAQPAVTVPTTDLEGFTWNRCFGNDRPVELEIGAGKAAFLLRRAQQYPHTNFLGIEWANEFYKYAADRMQRWNIPNVRMLRTDAAYFIRVICPRDSLRVLHIYHPDPWPKARHHKRRLLQPAFIDAAFDCLVTGGRMAVQTDHAEYFRFFEPTLRDHPRARVAPFDDPAFGVTDAQVATNFEIKYRREGRQIYQIAVEKIR